MDVFEVDTLAIYHFMLGIYIIIKMLITKHLYCTPVKWATFSSGNLNEEEFASMLIWAVCEGSGFFWMTFG